MLGGDQVSHQGRNPDPQVDHAPRPQFRQRPTGDAQPILADPGLAQRHRGGRSQVLRPGVHFDQVVDEAARGVNVIRVQLSQLHDVLHLRDHHVRGGGHGLVEVLFRHSIDQVAGGIRFPGMHQGDVGPQRRHEQVAPAVDPFGLGGVSKYCPDRGRGVEAAQPGAAGPDRFHERALRQELDRDPTGLGGRHRLRVGGEERADRPLDLPALQEPTAADPGLSDVVANVGQIVGTEFGQRVQQVDRVPGHPEAAHHQGCPVGHQPGGLQCRNLRDSFHRVATGAGRMCSSPSPTAG